jgi:hypothetical protein
VYCIEVYSIASKCNMHSQILYNSIIHSLISILWNKKTPKKTQKTSHLGATKLKMQNFRDIFLKEKIFYIFIPQMVIAHENYEISPAFAPLLRHKILSVNLANNKLESINDIQGEVFQV